MAEDRDGFMETQRRDQANRKSRRMMEDKDGFMETHREEEAIRKSRKRAEDKQGFLETQRRQKATSRETVKKENPAKLKEDQNKWKAKERSNAENSYLNEVRLAAIFPCVCCHTLNFRQQVVEFSQKQADSIKEKALAVYQKQKV